MATLQERPRLRGADHRLLRGYGPIVAIVATLLLIALLVPTIQPEEKTKTVATGAGTSAAIGSGQGATAGDAGASGTAGSAGTAAAAPPGAVACEGAQVPGDTYSPACLQWPAGADNGGATSPGVSATDINVTFRITSLANIADVVKQLTGGKVQINETIDDIKRTYTVLAQYFNERFQLYGRKINIKFFDGGGDLSAEALGGGQSGAQADAVRARQEQDAFADIFAFTQPYAEALKQQGVVALNQLYMSKDWYDSMSPYAFSLVPDCTKVVLAASDFVIKYLNGGNATYAGGDLKGKPRKIAIVAPNNPVYDSCGRAAEAKLKAAGVPVADYRSYSLDINSITNTTPQDLVSALSQEGITTVILGTDPVLPFFMSSKADLQQWYPEWVLTGVGLTDADYVGQLMNQESWKHTFGVSYLAQQQPVRNSDAYNAYKAVDPNGSVAELTGQLIYYSLEMLAIGIQGAGPNLTPETLKDGLTRYQGGTGQAGTWLFTPENPFTPNVDGRVVWWDGQAVSPYNQALGSYLDNGQRYPLGGFPDGQPPIFPNGPPS